jgi:hypothetical protein
MDLELIITGVIVTILAISGMAKIPRGARFGEVIQTTYGFRDAEARRLRTLVPLTELACAALLIVPPFRGIGYLATAGFLLTATYITSTSYLAGRGGDCGCFGDLFHQELGRGTIARLLLMLAALALAFSLRLSQASLHVPVSSEVLVALVAGALVLGVAGLVSGIRAFSAIRYSGDEP